MRKLNKMDKQAQEELKENLNTLSHNRENTIVLFDVDGTLTPAMKNVSPEMREYLQELRKKVTVGIVGGSNIDKHKIQMGPEVVNMFDYVFAENGLVAYKDAAKFHEMEFKKHLSEDQIKKLINFILKYIADLDIPVKRGTFVEFRTGMLNVSPIGRNCTYEERLEFNAYDNEHKIREKFVEALQKQFADYKLRYVIGGQISMDIFPEGWDKTYCLRHIRDQGFQEIHFWGDKTMPGGNDYEIYTSKECIGHNTEGPEDTLKQLQAIFG